MSVKSFKFVSPGVFINEIDNSFIPKTPQAIGPVIIGRSVRGPAMRPVKVESYSDFLNMFGDTVPGNGGGDIYRNGNFQSPMYGTYAAKAFLASNVAPITYVRLLGQETSVGSTAGGAASSGWKTTGKPTTGSDGGAYGLWIFPSGSNGLGNYFTGSNAGELAAIWYVQSGSVALAGGLAGTSSAPAVVTASSCLVESDANGNFKAVISGLAAGDTTTTFNFDDSSDLFIRKRFNTNPQLSSGQGDFYPSTSYQAYWLGETFEQEIRDAGRTGGTTGKLVGLIAGISSGSSDAVGPFNMKGAPSQDAVAGWFIGQDLGSAASFQVASAPKLFRLIGRGHGEWLHKNVKVSIEKIRESSVSTSDYGSFSLVLRSLLDTDSKVVILERFDNLSLDPTSPNYIARQIGTQYEEWDASERRLRTRETYPNLSKFVRVEMNADTDAGATDPTLLPFGYFGPPKLRDVSAFTASGSISDLDERFVRLGQGLPGRPDLADAVISSSYHPALEDLAVTASLNFPSVRLRSAATDGGLSDPRNAYFGFQVTRAASSTRPDASVADPERLWYAGLGTTSGVPADTTAASYNVSTSALEGYSYVFTMDNVSASGDSVYTYASGSRRAGNSSTARSTNTYVTLLDAGYDRFTAPFWGGFDGVDITVPDPFYNKGMTDISSTSEDNSYAYNTIKQAIDTLADPEYLDMNLLAVPGLTVDSLTTHAVNVCEERGDALALIDLPNVYIPSSEQYFAAASSRIGTTPTSAATALRNRQVDSSYGATFYPWVQTRDEGTGQLVWIPPTVAMMGVLASSQASSKLWFAPAGFNRGGLSDGAAGIPISNVTERLTSKDRDTLYEASINPIASFPSSGIVVFGQKTLQERQSALDRINVRRMVIFLKKQISLLATQVLFDQNVQSTWNRFKGLIEPLLANTKIDYGISDYRLILDESTTTPDLIDQNILYAKIMVKPARAIEYIAIDFVIASTGASFDD